eukprot:CAMPEP_0113918914 /NCGR_PEP_ID=MMETSP0780_2-20120614/33630_1 /TAXON_ID=652834 /ORGANISM="Palpitomonas bilix" /LENGTH=397 /DNA_ID=CAMNT_0000918803 /DNA_START=269 /DNA_END=1462 /DNA_ORIENTATION=- /assembly_acc=CAM_ASM_000599
MKTGSSTQTAVLLATLIWAGCTTGVYAQMQSATSTQATPFDCSTLTDIESHLGIGDIIVQSGSKNEFAITADTQLLDTLSFHAQVQDSTLYLYNRGSAKGLFNAHGMLTLTADCSARIASISDLGHPTLFIDTNAASANTIMIGSSKNETNTDTIVVGDASTPYKGNIAVFAQSSLQPSFWWNAPSVCIDAPLSPSSTSGLFLAADGSVDILFSAASSMQQAETYVDIAVISDGNSVVDACAVRGSAIEASGDATDNLRVFPMQSLTTLGAEQVQYVKSSANPNLKVVHSGAAPVPMSECAPRVSTCGTYRTARYARVSLSESPSSPYGMTGTFYYDLAPWAYSTLLGVLIAVVSLSAIAIAVTLGVLYRRRRHHRGGASSTLVASGSSESAYKSMV